MDFFKKKDVVVYDDIMVEDNNTITKKQKLLNLFSETGFKHSQGYVLEETGIKNQATLKTVLNRLRKENINIKMKFGYLIRVA